MKTENAQTGPKAIYTIANLIQIWNTNPLVGTIWWPEIDIDKTQQISQKTLIQIVKTLLCFHCGYLLNK